MRTIARGGAAAAARARTSRAVAVVTLGSAWLGLAALAMGGCAATAHRRPASAAIVLAGHPRVALLPLENLSGRADAGDIFGRVLFTELARTGCCEVIEPGRIEAALDSLGIRYTGALTVEDTRRIAARLGADYLLVGSVLEIGTVRTPDGEVPSASATLRMLEPDSARVQWAGAAFRTGEDRESVFGYGRERSAERLQAALAAELLKPFWPDRPGRKGKGGS